MLFKESNYKHENMKVFILDLDFTLWNAGDTWCSETNPPYIWIKDKLFDQDNRWIRLYSETIPVLEILRQEQKIIAVASRTNRPEWAKNLLNIFNINHFFDQKEIYPGNKVTHLKKIRSHFGYPYKQMVFFDDEQRNIEEARDLGIISIKIDNGISIKDIKKSL